MSWSVNAKGTPAEVQAELTKSFGYPLADPPAGLSDDAERATVALVREALLHCVGTFGEKKIVSVSAYGHASFDNWDTREGRTQNVTIKIEPAAPAQNAQGDSEPPPGDPGSGQ